MATISSHTLNGVDGTHAEGIAVTLRDTETGGIIFEDVTGSGGRLVREVGPECLGGAGRYELTFATGAYWAARGHADKRIVDEIVLRFSIDDPGGSYHMPIILTPHSYSTWKSG